MKKFSDFCKKKKQNNQSTEMIFASATAKVRDFPMK